MIKLVKESSGLDTINIPNLWAMYGPTYSRINMSLSDIVNTCRNTTKDIVGTPTSKYMTILLYHTLSGTYTQKLVFSNDLNKCKKIANNWLNYKGGKISKSLYDEKTNWALVFDIKNNRVIQYDKKSDYESVSESYKKLHEQVDISTYSTIKNKALSFIQDTDKKTVKLVSNSEHYSLDDVLEIYDKLVKDKDIKQSLMDNDFIGKLNISSNRYAQLLPILTMHKVRSKTGKSGWSKWTVTSESLRLCEQDVEIEVKHEGILEVPEGKNVDDLPISHFEKLAKKKGLSKITRALNNLQVWNKNDNPKLSKWAGDMIDKLNKRMEKKESIRRLKEDSLDDIVKPEIEKRYIWPLYEDAKYEIVEIIKKYQNSMRYKDEILSFDFKDIDFRNWPALQLELTCSNEPYALIYDELKRAGLFMDEDDEDFE